MRVDIWLEVVEEILDRRLEATESAGKGLASSHKLWRVDSASYEAHRAPSYRPGELRAGRWASKNNIQGMFDQCLLEPHVRAESRADPHTRITATSNLNILYNTMKICLL